MDALLTNTQKVQSVYPYWDFEVISGSVPIIYDAEAESQEATVIAYTQKGLIKQYPSIGINWTGFLTGVTDANGIDTQIVQSLSNNKLKYKPVYSSVGNKIVLNIVPM